MKPLIIATAILLAVLACATSCARVAPPDEAGPYQIGNYSVSYNNSEYGTFDAKIRYPALSDGELAPCDVSGSPYPGIVVSSGRSGGEWSVTWISERLASHGYVTLAFTPPDAMSNSTTQWTDGFTGGIAELKTQNDTASSPIYGMVDTDTFGVIGFSMGGAGCIEAAGTNGSDVDAIVALAPAGYNASGAETVTMSAARNTSVPIQLQIGTADSFVPPERVSPYYFDLIPDTAAKEYIVIDGGNHIGFLDQVFAEVADSLDMDAPGTIGFEEQRRISGRYFTAWFQYHLKGIEGYRSYIYGDGAVVGNVSTFEYDIP
ncbi:MAG: dienelactone hydrolase family protein [Chloroflexota bacterium]|nr:dienelactone hydrolase family protein [Chloroflexota bacterium]